MVMAVGAARIATAVAAVETTLAAGVGGSRSRNSTAFN